MNLSTFKGVQLLIKISLVSLGVYKKIWKVFSGNIAQMSFKFFRNSQREGIGNENLNEIQIFQIFDEKPRHFFIFRNIQVSTQKKHFQLFLLIKVQHAVI